MQKTLTTLVALVLGGLVAFAGQKGKYHRYAVSSEAKAITGEEPGSASLSKVPVPQAPWRLANMGPGTMLMDTGYDYQNNGNMQVNIVNYGDGTFAVARMAAAQADLADRGSWFTYFDGTQWSPISKVEATRRGWTDTDVLSDGRQVVTSHTGNEFNVDALKGFGIWTSSITGYIEGATDHIWPRVAVDGADNIHIVTTLRVAGEFPNQRYGTYYPVYTWSTDGGNTWNHKFIFGDPFTELDTTDTRWGGFSIDCYPVEAWGTNKVATMTIPRYGLSGASNTQAVIVAESEDNGSTWDLTTIAEWPRIPEDFENGSFRPSLGCDLAYDNDGNIHVITTNLLILQDSVGAATVSSFNSEAAPMRHWSEATGWTDILAYEDLPGFDPNQNIYAGINTVNNSGAGNSTVLKSPSIGFDADNNIYFTFSSPAPNDTAPDGSAYYDVYAVGSGDGGGSWGPAVNLTASGGPGLEDTDASLARLVDDNLHIIYNSDPQVGYSSDSGAPPFRTNMMYYAFAKADIPLTPPSAVTDRPNGKMPVAFALHEAYPNPFNPSTNLTFELPQAASVKLAIYDSNGRMIAELVNGKMAAGIHSVVWSAGLQAVSGVYFARLEADGFSSVKKLMLVK